MVSILEDFFWVIFVYLMFVFFCWLISVISRCWSLIILFNGSLIGKMVRVNDGMKCCFLVNIILVDVGIIMIVCYYFDCLGIFLYYIIRKVSVELYLFNLLYDWLFRVRVCSYIVKIFFYILVIINSILLLLWFFFLWSC